jgi:hypothetical protein
MGENNLLTTIILIFGEKPRNYSGTKTILL